MKKIYLLYIVLISLATTSLIGCSDWTESETKTFPESIVSDEYYAALRAYKQTDHQVLLKEWMINNRRVSQMEKAHVVSEVERLKEQISPELLFKTLHQSGELTLSESETASKMLMKLSQLLRYQLYDCNRAKVLLSSEITFLTNYLTLEQTSRPQFYYEFTSEGEVNRMLVPPLLFIPFVQYIVKAIDEQQIQPPVSLKTHLKAEKGTIIFACACPEVNLLSFDKGLERIRQRLDILYGSRYRLSLAVGSIWLELKGGES